MKKIRLAIVRQKYRPDGGAERFISRALEALDNGQLELNILTRQWSGEAKLAHSYLQSGQMGANFSGTGLRQCGKTLLAKRKIRPGAKP
jgi:hypothetical protein